MSFFKDMEYFYENGGNERAKQEREELEKNNEVLRNKVGEYTIDSCWTFDCGYETAIWRKNNPVIIVERYETEEDMKKGHKKWKEFCKGKPIKVYSVQLDEMCEL